MSVKKFIVALPVLCRAKNASRWSKVNELQFDYELDNEGSVFERNADDEKNPANRLDTLFGFVGDEARTTYCRGLCELAFLSHYKNEHGENRYDDRIKFLRDVLIEDEINYPDIMDVMSVTEAVNTSFWNG